MSLPPCHQNQLWMYPCMQNCECILALLEATGSSLTRRNIENLAELSKNNNLLIQQNLVPAAVLAFSYPRVPITLIAVMSPPITKWSEDFSLRIRGGCGITTKLLPLILIFNPHKGTEMNTWDGNQFEGSREWEGKEEGWSWMESMERWWRNEMMDELPAEP